MKHTDRCFATCLLLVFGSVWGCASSPITPVSTTTSEIIDYPEIGAVVIANLGEKLVAKGIRTTGPSLTVTRMTVFGKKQTDKTLFCAFTVHPSSAFEIGVYQTEFRTAQCFGPFTVHQTNPDGTTGMNCRILTTGNICRDPSDGSYFVLTPHVHAELKEDDSTLEIGTAVIEQEANFVQELIYNGRVDDNLKFIYRELSGNLVRPAFTQEVQYDFDASSIVGFQKLRLEILKADNTNITYRVLTSF